MTLQLSRWIERNLIKSRRLVTGDETTDKPSQSSGLERAGERRGEERRGEIWLFISPLLCAAQRPVSRINGPVSAWARHTHTLTLRAGPVIACKQHTLFRQRYVRTHIGFSHFKSTGSTCFSPTEPRAHTRRCVHSLTLCLFSRPTPAVRVSLALFRRQWSMTARCSPEKSRSRRPLPLRSCDRFGKYRKQNVAHEWSLTHTIKKRPFNKVEKDKS